MSRHARRRSALAAALLSVAPLLCAQTIADYSRAQRTLLESAMAQWAARSAGLAASAPPASASAATPVAPSPSPATAPHPALPPPGPAVQVSGTFASADGVVVEVLVNATAYLLNAGEDVPGTRWQVESIAVDRVVLSHRGGVAGDPGGTRKVFALPALR